MGTWEVRCRRACGPGLRGSGISPLTSTGWNSVVCLQPPVRETGKFYLLSAQWERKGVCVVIGGNICHMKLLIITYSFMHVEEQ